MQEVEEEFGAKEKHLREQLKREMNQLLQEQMRELQEMQGEFAQASELMDQKYWQLNERFLELQELYENRPSRPEDLELVRQLQEDVAQKDALLKKAAEDMKFYKLELINREDSYNKMFGTNPNVGVINPLGVKPQTGKQAMVTAGKPGLGVGGTQMAAAAMKDGRKNSRMVQ